MEYDTYKRKRRAHIRKRRLLALADKIHDPSGELKKGRKRLQESYSRTGR